MRTMRNLLIFLFVLITSYAQAADVVICQTGTDDNLPIVAYLTSVNTPDYDSDPKNIINPDLSALAGVATKFWKCSGGSVVEMTTVEKNTFYLEDDKLAKIEEIVATSQELINAGFTYSTKTFGLTDTDKIKWVWLHEVRNELSYPFDILADDGTYYAVASSTAMHAFYMAALNFELAVYFDPGGEQELINSVNACLTLDCVEIVADDRIDVLLIPK